MVQAVTLSGFDAFWATYPRREAKKDAMKAWAQIGADVDEALQMRILDNLATRPWPRDRRYIPLPATYLRGARYEDELVPAGQVAPEPPANRWQPTANPTRLIPGGQGVLCHHDPMCATDLDHVRLMLAEQETS